MQIFHSSEQFYNVLNDLFQQVSENPKNIETFTRSNMVIRLKTTDPEAELLLDGRQPPLEVFFGPRPGAANIEISLPASLLHRMWTGLESTSAAFFSGKVKVKGNMLKAMQLFELFEEAERLYPAVAKSHGVGTTQS
jgi:putative sterol carrier protein